MPTQERVDYSSTAVSNGYECSSCGAVGCKLWRESYTFSSIELLCADCAAKNQGKSIEDIDADGRHSSNVGRRTDQIGWYVPAVPCEDSDGYWGYTSVPEAGVNWWKRLPTTI